MKLMKDKNFRRLIIGQATSGIGSNMQQFALSLYVLAITGSATIFASMVAISILPRLLLSPIAGVFGDWFDRKKSIVRLDLLNGVLIGICAYLYYINGGLSIGMIYAIVIILEITEIFFGCSMAAVIPSIVEKDRLFEANQIKAIFSSVTQIISPLVASSLYAFMGLQMILIVNAVSFIISALSEMTIDIPKFNKKPTKLNLKSFVIDLKEGIAVVKNSKVLKLIIGLGVVLNFSFSAVFSVGLIYTIKETMHGTEIQYGVITSTIAIASLIGPLVVGKIVSKNKIGSSTIKTFLLINSMIVLMGVVSSQFFLSQFSSNLIPLITLSVIAFIIIVLSTIVNIAIGTLFDQLVPIEFMGRAASIMNLCLMIAMPLGQVLFGVGVDNLSVSLTIFIVNAIVFLTLAYFYKPFAAMDKDIEHTLKKLKADTENAPELRLENATEGIA